MLNAKNWWAKCLPAAAAAHGDALTLIPLDIEDHNHHHHHSSWQQITDSSDTSSSGGATRTRRRSSIIKACFNSAFILIGTILIALSVSLIDRSLSTWADSKSAQQQQSRLDRFHRTFLSSGSNATIHHHLQELTKQPHVAGSPQDFATAEYVRSELQRCGLQTHLTDYQVLLSFPSQRNLSLLHANGSLIANLPLQEQQDQQNISTIIPTFHAYSPSGSAQGEVVYVNYGREEDYELLGKLGVDVKGAVVLARYGSIFRGDMVENAARAGAVAAIIYSDPADYAANGTQGYYPDSSWLPPSGVQRGTVFQGTGDPSTPGWASGVGNSERIDGEELRKLLPLIPSLPISAQDAEPILKSIGGPVAPSDWQGGFLSIQYKLGRGPTRLDFHYTANQTVSAIRNVLGVIRGYEEPDRFILLGNHRDAWTFGAVDPASGTATLLETASRLGKLLKAGWKPRRTIVLCSWDAEEFGMIGSTEWVEQNLDLLGAKAVAYLNVDCAVSGPGFFAAATPQLDDLLIDIAKKVKDPDSPGRTVYESWMSESSGATTPLIDRLGSTGSDYVAFLHHAGVPAIDMYFGKSYPVYHSLYDNYDWMKKYGDPYFSRHVAVSSLWGLMALRLADCLVLPFNYKSYATELQAYGKAVEAALRGAKAPHNVTASPLRISLAEFVEGATHVGDESLKLKNEHPLMRRNFNDRLMLAERAFLEEGGLAGRTWFKHLVYGPAKNNKYGTAAFPGILDAIREASGSKNAQKWSAVQHEIWRVSRVLSRATLVLRGELT